ncbi:RNA polymerase sigma factor [Ancylobacter sp. MQZ15Z-1]|uniref:RNA polymerase sigma factor n=1 Tax=Ancylobacter mangrovi TaxID=2972472 RepID=A0A9X2T3Z2_9HYPH|nr:RNA polymerase sigma factor [Ancylobacter mangrovi]MCS0497662.1 RNA polymerase sigma factor [Ancylobacter mangrovi]
MDDMVTLLEPLIPPLRRYARALMRDRAAADDLVQDCLELAISRWHQRREGSDARSWTFAILHNLAISRMRQSKRRGVHVPLDDLQQEVVAQAPDQDQGLRQHDVMKALDALPEEQKNVLLLVSVEDLSYAEAARVLDIPIGTVMSRLARARERLRHIMEPGAQGGGEAGQVLPFRQRRVK